MFDIGWSEMAVVGLIALIVIGPKELPNAMRMAAKWARKGRAMAREFQSGIDDMIRDADLDDARKAVEATRNLDTGKILDETVDPTGAVRADIQDLEESARDTGTTGGSPAPDPVPDPKPKPKRKSKPKPKSKPRSKPKSKLEPSAESLPNADNAGAGDDVKQRSA